MSYIVHGGTAFTDSLGKVSRIIPGTDVTVDPTDGRGAVTVNSTGGGGWPPPTNKFQAGSVNIAAGNQGPYAVLFSPALSGAPVVVDVQVYMNDVDGEILFATVQKDTVSSAGFSFWLSGVPADTGGVAKWSAQT